MRQWDFLVVLAGRVAPVRVAWPFLYFGNLTRNASLKKRIRLKKRITYFVLVNYLFWEKGLRERLVASLASGLLPSAARSAHKTAPNGPQMAADRPMGPAYKLLIVLRKKVGDAGERCLGKLVL